MLTLLSILGSVLPVVGMIAIAAYFMDWRREVVTVTTPEAPPAAGEQPQP